MTLRLPSAKHMNNSHKAEAVLAKHDQIPKPQHVIKYYIISVKSTGHLNLHAYDTPEGGWDVYHFLNIFKKKLIMS